MKFILLAFLFAGCFCADAETPAQPPIPEAAARGPGAFEVRVPAPGPDAIADTVIQDAIDAVAAAGGGVVLLGVGDFKLSRHAGDETVVIKSNVMVRGNQLRKPGNYSLQASGWIWSGNSHPGGSLTIAPGAEGNVVHGNVVTAEITDPGTKTDLANNVIRSHAR